MSGGNGEIPEFKADYIPAFCALMLHKLGGMQQIAVELLEKFPKKDIPVISWNPKTKAFVMKNPKKRERSIIKPSRRIITRSP